LFFQTILVSRTKRGKEYLMSKFQIGDTVEYAVSSRVLRKFPDGAYKVMSLMPREDNQSETAYRIKSAAGDVLRVAKEGELAPFG
jgi:hypothetical protein